VDEQLSFNIAVGAQLEGRDISGPGAAVGAAGSRKQVLAAAGGEADITAVFIRRRDAWFSSVLDGAPMVKKLTCREQWVGDVREYRDMALLVNHIHRQPVPRFHQRV
jgi:hypothetical protein